MEQLARKLRASWASSTRGTRRPPWAGMTVVGLMMAIKVLPFVPGHFSVAKFAVLAG